MAQTDIAPSKGSRPRLAFLDWTRGLAGLIMLQGHTFHSFTRPELRSSDVYVLSQFVGGIPPAIFLFLTGVTLGFLMDARERQRQPAGRRVVAALRRAGYLLALAIGFRIQMWVFALPKSPWTDLFKVDVLNTMALAIVVLSPLAVVGGGAERARAAAALGVLIAALSPLASAMDWTWLHPFARHYIAPDYFYFGFFPWAAFLAFGLAAGSLLRVIPAEQIGRAIQWAAMAGFGLILGGRYFSDLPYSLYPKSEFWLDSPALVFIKLGVILLMLAAAYLWTEYGAGPRRSWLRLLGIHSLLVYWVHTELVYGRWFWFWKESLPLAPTAVAALVVTALMFGLAAWKENWPGWKPRLGSVGFRAARSAAGD